MKLGLVREDFSLHAENTFAALFENNELTDVTLVCEDSSEEVKAHKIILSCGSGFFKDLFRRHPQQQQPIVYLRFSTPQTNLNQFRIAGSPIR